jgi:carboxylesterase type B
MQLIGSFRLFVNIVCILTTIGQVNGLIPTVKLRSGVEIHGTVNATTPSVQQFLSIPFAQPPIGSLRWAPPQKLDSIPDVIDATVLGPSCPQGLSNGSSLYTKDVLQFNIDGSVSEDCLALSVWTPRTVPRNQLLPVLVFIYGGGFSTGGMNVPYQIPAQWVQRSQKHIVASFKFRSPTKKNS